MNRAPISDEELEKLIPHRRDISYGPRYFKFADGDHGPASELFGDVLYSLFKPSSAIDFGCGTGGTLAALAAHGVEVQAVDGSEHCIPFVARRNQQIANELLVHDLSKPLELKRQYDLAISTECFEHLPPGGSEVLVSTVAAAAPRAVITACGPTGKNPLHTNERPFEFWMELFEKNGMKLNRGKTGELRVIMRQHKENLPAGVPLVPSWYFGGYIGIFEKEK